MQTSWSHGPNRSMYTHSVPMSGHSAVQSAWIGLAHKYRELSKLVDMMACQPTAEQYYAIYNAHSSLFAKMEDLEPSPEPVALGSNFTIPPPPKCVVLPDLNAPVFFADPLPLDDNFSFGAPLHSISPHSFGTAPQPAGHPSSPHNSAVAAATPASHHASSAAPATQHHHHHHHHAQHHATAVASSPYKAPSRYGPPPSANSGFIAYQPTQTHSPQQQQQPQQSVPAAPSAHNAPVRPLPYVAEEPPAFGKSPEPAARCDSLSHVTVPAAAPRIKRKPPPGRRRVQHKESSSSDSIGTPEDESDSDEREKRRRKNRAKDKRHPTILNQACRQCGATETPEWRRGPDGSHTLCNACGLRFSKQLRKFREEEPLAQDAMQAPPFMEPTDPPLTQPAGHADAQAANEQPSDTSVADDVPRTLEAPPFGTNA